MEFWIIIICSGEIGWVVCNFFVSYVIKKNIFLVNWCNSYVIGWKFLLIKYINFEI